MYAVFCGVHIVVLIGVFVLFLLCVRNTTSPAKLSFMLICFSLFILIFGMYLEMVDSDTTEAAISVVCHAKRKKLTSKIQKNPPEKNFLADLKHI